MFDRFMRTIAPRGAMAVAAAFVLFIVFPVLGQSPTSPPTSGPATQPARYTHEDLVKQSAKDPLFVEEYHNKAGKPLTADETAEIEKSNKLMDAARKSRAEGDFTAATEAYTKALTSYKQILGLSYYRTISAQVLADSLNQMKSASAGDQGKLVEADKLQAQAEAAHEKGEYVDAVKAAQKALQIREDILGKDNAEVALTLRILGNAQCELGRNADAADVLDRSLKMTESIYGPDHPQTALVLDRLGWVRINQGNLDDAIQLESRAVRVLRGTVGETAETAEVLDNSGTALAYGMRDPDRALKSKLRAFVIREKLLGPDAKDTGVSLSNLAWFYGQTALVSADDVLALRKRALAIFERTLGPRHPWTVLEAGHVARQYAIQGNVDEAIKLYEQLVAQDQTQSDQLADRVIDRLINLASLYLALNRVEDGTRALDRAFELGKALYAKGDVQPALGQMDSLANLCQGWRMYERVARVGETVRGWTDKLDQKPDDVSMNRLLRLGSAYRDLGRLEDARKVLQDLVKIGDSLKGDDIIKTVAPLLLLSSVYEKLGQLDEAERVCTQALRVTESKITRSSRGQAYTLMAMGRIQVKQKNLDMAKFSLEEARRIFEREENVRADPSALIMVLQELAACRAAEGKQAEAIELNRQALTQARAIETVVKNVNTKALLAGAVKQLLDVLKDDSPAAKKEADSLKAELKQLLEDLRKNEALTAENKEWLKALGE